MLLNAKANNFPVDVRQDHQLIEVKTGLVSNSKSAQQWRATIGQPGKTETEWLKTASSEDKAAHNLRKAQEIIDRKQAAVSDYLSDTGHRATGHTYTTIINPDTRTADIYHFEGFHSRIAWNSQQAAAGYVRTVKY